MTACKSNIINLTEPGMPYIFNEDKFSQNQVSLLASRKDILEYFKNTWNLTELLFTGLANEEAYVRRPYHQLRHPMIFYYGHPVALYVNKLRVAGLLEGPVNAKLEALLETGVDEMRWDDLHEGKKEIWPSVAEVREYRQEVYSIIKNLIETHPLLEDKHLPITQESPMWALVMGFEHERIHLETSSVLIRELPIEFVKKPQNWPAIKKSGATYPVNKMLNVSSCEVKLGKPNDFPSFGWDNEYGSEARNVSNFSASSNLISNGEFLQFVKDGGYGEEKYWSREGWSWRRFRNIKWPTFWVQNGPSGSHIYKLRTIFEVVDMQDAWPVCVNFHEAKAYCAWKTEKDKSSVPYRLLTEAEHNAIRDGKKHEYNLDLRLGSESPVDEFEANDKGFHDVFGNVWQWCEDHFHPLTGGKPHPYYDDFSAPCYDGEHQMILGGSFISTGEMADVWARFHFRAHFFQHAGFRVVKSEDGINNAKIIYKEGTSAYDTEEMLSRYMLMHWGSDNEIFSNALADKKHFPAIVNLPVKCAELVKKFASKFDNALDLGCAVGRSTFEMARDFGEVTGIDYSNDFIDSADILKRNGNLSYSVKNSGNDYTKLTVKIDSAIQRKRIQFEQGDACALPQHIKDFDAVLVANVLCRLRDPKLLLERLQGVNALVKPGGILVLTTPFSWLAEYTAEDKWIGGIDGVAKILTQFELLHQEELPFVIREHARKFEYIVTKASVWKRKIS